VPPRNKQEQARKKQEGTMTTKERDHHDVDHCDGTNPRRIDFFLFMWVILKNAEVPGSGNTSSFLCAVAVVG
jgi:hypothetical protein